MSRRPDPNSPRDRRCRRFRKVLLAAWLAALTGGLVGLAPGPVQGCAIDYDDWLYDDRYYDDDWYYDYYDVEWHDDGDWYDSDLYDDDNYDRADVGGDPEEGHDDWFGGYDDAGEDGVFDW